MKRLSLVIGILAALAAPGASAQSVNLTGIYTCVDKCQGGSLPMSRKTDIHSIS